MISIGNDIVALSAINRQRTNDIRFHSKFVTPTELALYQEPAIAALPFESFVWLLWSVKESAYKYQKRLDSDLIFSPAKIIVQIIDIPQTLSSTIVNDIWETENLAGGFIGGNVYINQTKLCFKSIINDDLIATVVDQNPLFQNIHWGIQRIIHQDTENQSDLVRMFLLNNLYSIYPNSNFSLQKSSVGYPILFDNDIETEMLISLAHHHQYISYTFKLNGEY